jgi:hypothetical protein
MSKTFLSVIFFISFLVLNTEIVYAKLQSVTSDDKTYYIVDASNPDMNTGNKVCAAAGAKCVGYTDFTTNACKAAHKNAAIKSDANGSKAGFYCDGAPQGGVCANEKNTCHICPNCNVNATCETQIGDLYREMYVECSGGEVVAAADPTNSDKITGKWKNFMNIPGRWWGIMRSTVARSFDEYRKKLAVLVAQQVKYGKITVQGPNGNVEVNAPVDSLICEFYQNNKKLVTCGALAAADQFCVTAFGSRFAKAELCQEDGVIICSKPCVTNPTEVKPKMCAFDNDRPRGKQAPPIDLCTETMKVKVDMGNLGTKKAGQECKHGGECGTGICLGQPSDSGIKYFCSCKQNAHDTSCGK